MEKDSELGGNFRIASYPTGKGQISEAIRSMIVRAKQAGVNIRLNTEATEEPLRALAPNAVILATGSVPLVLPIPGLADCGYVTAQDLLLGKTAAGRRAWWWAAAWWAVRPPSIWPSGAIRWPSWR